MLTKVLITGASGYLGQHLLTSLASDSSLKLHAAYGQLPSFVEDFGAMAECSSLDLQDEAAVRALVGSIQPDVVIHLAAVSSPAVCEKEPESSKKLITLKSTTVKSKMFQRSPKYRAKPSPQMRSTASTTKNHVKKSSP